MSGTYGSGTYGAGLYGTGTPTNALHYYALRQLFPVKDGVLGGVYDSDVTIEGAHLDNAYDQAQVLLTDMFGDTSVTLLESWERVLGLTATGTVADRQAAVTAQLRVVVNKDGRLTKSYYLGLAVSLGHPEAYIVEGAALSFIVAPSPFESALPHAVWGDEVNFTWTIDAVVTAGHDRDVWEAFFNGIKPGWTQLLFTYS